MSLSDSEIDYTSSDVRSFDLGNSNKKRKCAAGRVEHVESRFDSFFQADIDSLDFTAMNLNDPETRLHICSKRELTELCFDQIVARNLNLRDGLKRLENQLGLQFCTGLDEKQERDQLKQENERLKQERDQLKQHNTALQQQVVDHHEFMITRGAEFKSLRDSLEPPLPDM